MSEVNAGRREMKTLAVALLASLLLWNVPYGGYALYPMKLLATWLHEMSHGLVMLLTGAGFDYLVVYRDTSGLAYSTSPLAAWSIPFIAAAGYMGTPLWGAVVLRLTPNASRARIVLGILGGLVLASAVTVVAIDDGGDAFGPWAVGALGVGILACAFALPARWRLFAAHFIGAQACINALLDIRVLLRPFQVVGGSSAQSSDAHAMAASTFGTTAHWAVWTWAGIWLAWSLAILFVALRFGGSLSGSRRRRAGSRAAPTAAPRDESDRDERRRSPATAPGETDPT